MAKKAQGGKTTKGADPARKALGKAAKRIAEKVKKRATKKR